MKTYPSISRFNRRRHLDFVGHTFAKQDGSNLRFEWNPQKGWYRFGSRRRLLDTSHPTFGGALKQFEQEFSIIFERAAIKHQWPGLIVYAEFWGKNSLAGFHNEEDQKFLTPFDIAVHKKGVLPPEQFLSCFDNSIDLGYLGNLKWDTQFIEDVQDSRLPGMSLEGVVGKKGGGSKRTAIKAKSKLWKKKVVEACGEVQGNKLIAS